jgi:uncharacterized cupredoxin-like copper-binding protein
MQFPHTSLFSQGAVHPLRAALVVVGAIGLLTIPTVVGASPLNSATVQFGNPNAPGAAQNCDRGPAPPAESCANAFHKIIPGAVAIRSGETVDFVRNGFHQVAIYAPGKMPNDILVTGAATGRVNDTNGRLFLSNAAAGTPANPSVTPPASTFTQPGRYLVICNILGHWNDNMWGFVEVQP